MIGSFVRAMSESLCLRQAFVVGPAFVSHGTQNGLRIVMIRLRLRMIRTYTKDVDLRSVTSPRFVDVDPLRSTYPHKYLS